MKQVLADLVAEQDALDEVVSAIDGVQWNLETASAGWTVADQIGHLAYFDATAALAISDPDAFRAHVGELLQLSGKDDAVDGLTLAEFRAMTPRSLLTIWRSNRTDLEAVAGGLADDTRVIWYGPSMGAKSFLTARLMECWAHGQDVVDAIGAHREPTDRLIHIVRLGFITRGWTYANRGLDVPGVDVSVQLVAPSGAEWTLGPENAECRVSGSAEDFCLVVTQRRHVDDTDLVIDGAPAREWMGMAQAFAGPATDGPAAGTR